MKELKIKLIEDYYNAILANSKEMLNDPYGRWTAMGLNPDMTDDELVGAWLTNYLVEKDDFAEDMYDLMRKHNIPMAEK